ncbi:conserved membrane hypothetical protein [Bradyrhizobium oligotrophicum S58]|uniref:Glycosyltransferase RgtA/B/C/D-like domain-containing protein n=1 Tax=Bradyrhizobium oligotrophicum S58 TaxID=1245469 RepID=M4Z0Z6_9BRAD|nr:hypothetical protein [Bradyrhizobium oligotrophicum]BAM86201.1 conserved membrane hypothetical protein [Bradyrhizobium oligotrophicum S58]
MTIDVQADGGFVLQPVKTAERWSGLTGWLVLVTVFAVGILMRQLVAANSDVSWLLIAGERWLEGQRLYSEILETNPPMAVLVYVPGILLARALDLPAERVVDAMVMIAVVLSLGLSASILRRSTALSAGQRWPLAITALLVLVVLPVQSFGQREHIAVIELMPVFAVLALRINREAPSLWGIAVAGVGLGLALCFKPHFSLAMLSVYALLAARLKSPRILCSLETVIAAALVVGYGACTVMFFPEYFSEMWPLIRDVYSVGLPLGEMVMKPAIALWAITLMAALALQQDRGVRPTMLLLLTGAIAFAFVYLLQRKGWPYHSYPMMAFAWLGFGYAIGSWETGPDQQPRRPSIGTAAVAASLFMAGMVWFNHVIDVRMLQPAIARLGLAHPTILAISGDGGIGHPLTRAVGGIWASRQQSLLIASYANYVRATESGDSRRLAVFQSYLERERRGLIDDFRRTSPAIVLVDNMTGHWGQWLRASPELERLLRDYRLSETVGDIDIYVRRSS